MNFVTGVFNRRRKCWWMRKRMYGVRTVSILIGSIAAGTDISGIEAATARSRGVCHVQQP